MTLEALSPEEVKAKIAAFLEKVPGKTAIGNKSLRESLGTGWSADEYWYIRSRLIEDGTLETGKGRGGSVKRVASVIVPCDKETEAVAVDSLDKKIVLPPNEVVTNIYASESNLYPPISVVLRTLWSKAQGFDSYIVEITGKQGSRQTGGKWSRPDIIFIGYKTFPYVPGVAPYKPDTPVGHMTTAAVPPPPTSS